jgi:hypothetical protein
MEFNLVHRTIVRSNKAFFFLPLYSELLASNIVHEPDLHVHEPDIHVKGFVGT